MTLFALGFTPVLIALGFWQLGRAEEKRALEAAVLDRMASRPVAPEGWAADFLRVELAGEYHQGHDFLLDNQLVDGRAGYLVLSVFRDHRGRAWLLERGLLAAGTDRSKLPVVEHTPGPLVVTGTVWPDTGDLLLLAEDVWTGGWPKRIQRLDRQRIAGLLGQDPVQLVRLDATSAGALSTRDLQTDFRSDRHTGYAVQWFGLAAVLAVGYVIFGMRRHD